MAARVAPAAWRAGFKECKVVLGEEEVMQDMAFYPSGDGKLRGLS